MKKIQSLASALVLIASVFSFSSCNEQLELGPIDYYGSGNFWTAEAQFDGYIYSLNNYLRNLCQTRTMFLGECRGGLYKATGGTTDGSTTLNIPIILSNLSAENTLSNFAGYYGAITQTNLFLKRTEATEILPAAKKSYYLGIAYGIRAFLYFDLYRSFGEVPYRTDVEVIEGETDPTKLYMARSSADDVINNIKADIKKSLDNFGDVSNFNPYGHGAKITWSKAATEYLAGEVYLWNAKVSVDGNLGKHAAEPGDIATAKTYFNNVINNYGLALEDDFVSVFNVSNKGGKEVIFAIRYLENEASNPIGVNYTHMTDGRGNIMHLYDANGNQFGDPFQLNGGGSQWYEYKNALWESFNPLDSRRDITFAAAYNKKEDGSLVLASTPVGKNLGHVNAAGVHVYDGDQIYYRLAGAYLALAEIANYEGNNGDVEKYINIIRKRAFAEAWDESTMGYKASDFKTNEIAVLYESDKEFVNEGHRWWDLCRMTTVKGGADTDHLAFCAEVCPSTDPTIPNQPVLKTSEAHKLLWPIDKTLLGSDPELKQTKGY